MDKKFIFHWLDGSKSISIGPNATEALRQLGYNDTDIDALDWYEEMSIDAPIIN